MSGSEKGSVMVIVIVGITILAAIGGGVVSLVNSSARTGVNHSLSVQALYAAESGLEWAGSKLKESSSDWTDLCPDLDSHDELPVNIGGQARFVIVNPKLYYADEDPTGCEITVVGWVGSDKDNPLSSRRLKGFIPEDKIVDSDNKKDIFYKLVAWGGGGNNVSYENGLVFDVDIKKNEKNEKNKDTVSVKLNRNGNSEIVDEDSFDENSDVYFFVKIENWENVASLKIGHENSWEGNCDPISKCQDSEGSDTFSVLLKDISKENVNNSNVSLEVVFQKSGTVTFKEGCIASNKAKCPKTNSTSQNPVDSWNED